MFKQFVFFVTKFLCRQVTSCMLPCLKGGYSLQLIVHFLLPPVALFPVEDNGKAVVLFAVAGSSMQGTAVSETLYVPESFSIAGYPLLQDRLAVCSCCH